MAYSAMFQIIFSSSTLTRYLSWRSNMGKFGEALQSQSQKIDNPLHMEDMKSVRACPEEAAERKA